LIGLSQGKGNNEPLDSFKILCYQACNRLLIFFPEVTAHGFNKDGKAVCGFFSLATAVEHKAAVVTGDPEFKKVEHLVEVVWV